MSEDRYRVYGKNDRELVSKGVDINLLFLLRNRVKFLLESNLYLPVRWSPSLSLCIRVSRCLRRNEEWMCIHTFVYSVIIYTLYFPYENRWRLRRFFFQPMEIIGSSTKKYMLWHRKREEKRKFTGVSYARSQHAVRPSGDEFTSILHELPRPSREANDKVKSRAVSFALEGGETRMYVRGSFCSKQSSFMDQAPATNVRERNERDNFAKRSQQWMRKLIVPSRRVAKCRFYFSENPVFIRDFCTFFFLSQVNYIMKQFLQFSCKYAWLMFL